MIALQLAFIPFMLLFFALFFIFWIIMLVDAATRKFKDSTDKIVWVLVIVFAGIVGALVYYFVISRKNKSLKWFWITLFIIVAIMVIIFLLAFFSLVAA